MFRYLIQKIFVEIVISILSLTTNRIEVKVHWYSRFNLYLQKYWYASNYLNKHISVVDTVHYDNKPYQELPIWQLWLQGEQNAPPIVKKCFDSVDKYCDGRKVIRLNENTIHQYIDLPDDIWSKYHRGKIKAAHFSDIVRVCLLAKFGGTWIDSTVLLTDKIPNTILASPFFKFSMHPIEEYADKNKEFYLADNWFIHSQPNHIFMVSMKDSLFSYWKHKNKALQYFMYHILFSNFITRNQQMKIEWLSYPQISYLLPLQMYNQLTAVFDEELYHKIIQTSSIHKLNHRINDTDPKTFSGQILRTVIK